MQKFTGNIVDANSYLIVEDNKGLLIDAIATDSMFEAIKKLDELTVIITHCHFDHINAINDIRKIVRNTKIISSEKCSKKMGQPTKNMSSTANVFLSFYNTKNNINLSVDKIEPFSVDVSDQVFDKELLFSWEGHNVKLQSVYGHSDDGIIIIIDEINLFSGDSLLSIPTVTRFPSGSTRKYWEHDMPLFKSMSEDVMVYPGHGESGKLGDLIHINIKPEKYR